MPDPIPQPLDHRTFLQQFILALASRGVQGMPFEGIPSKVTAYAQDVWEGIEKSVKAAIDERADARIAEVARRRGVNRTSDDPPSAVNYGDPERPDDPDRPVEAFSRSTLGWQMRRAGEVKADVAEYPLWKEYR